MNTASNVNESTDEVNSDDNNNYVKDHLLAHQVGDEQGCAQAESGFVDLEPAQAISKSVEGRMPLS